jgi:hypothetical protein
MKNIIASIFITFLVIQTSIIPFYMLDQVNTFKFQMGIIWFSIVFGIVINFLIKFLKR